MLPNAVQHSIQTQLAEIGLSDSTLDVRNCSWRSAEFDNVCLDDGRCVEISAVSTRYSPRSLLQGKVKEMKITGGRVRMRIRDGKIELGKLANLKFKTNKSASPFFDRIQFSNCRISVDWHEKLFSIPFDGAIFSADDGQLEGHLSLNLQGVVLPIQFTFLPDPGTFSFSMEQNDIDVRALLTALPMELPTLPPWVTNPVNAQLEGSLVKTGFHLTVTATRPGKIPADRFQLNVDKTDKQTTLLGEASGDGWKLKQITATRPAEPTPGNPLRRTDVSWEFKGRIPKQLEKTLTGKGLDVARAGALNGHGRLRIDLPKATDTILPDFEVPELQIVFEPGELTIQQPKMVLQNFSGSLRLTGRCKNGHSTFHILPNSRLEFESAVADNWTSGKTSVLLHSTKDQNTIEMTVDNRGIQTRLHLNATCADTTIRVNKNPFTAKVENARLVMDTDPQATTGSLAIGEITCPLGASELVLSLNNALWTSQLIAADLIAPQLKSKLTIGSAILLNEKSERVFALDQQVMKPILSTYDVQKKEGSFGLQWPLQESAVLNAAGSVNFNGPLPSASVSFDCEGLHVREEQAAVKHLVDSTGLNVRGDLSVSGTARLHQGHFSPRITFTTTDTTLSNRQYQMEATGINGAITFTEFLPPSTPGNQRFHIQDLHLGKVHLQDGLVLFGVENDPPSILLERTEWGCLGGRIYSQALRIDPAQPTIDVNLFANNVDMEQLSRLVLGETGSGAGSLYGMISAKVPKSDLSHFDLGEGFLRSTTDTGFWELESRNVIGLIQNELKNQLDRVLQTSVKTDVKDNILHGLLDFEYSMFNVDFSRQESGILARITTRGHSRNLKVPVEFEEIILDIPGFDEILRKVLIIKKAIGQEFEPTQRSPIN